MEPSAYEYQYYEMSSGKSRVTSVTLWDNWQDYKMELEYIDSLVDRKIKREYIKVTLLYSKEDFKEAL